MPKLKEKIKKAKAELLLKPILKHNLNIAAAARELKIAQPTLHEKFHRPAVQEALKDVLRKIGIDNQRKAKKFSQLLDFKKIQDCDVFIKDENGKLKVNKNSNDFIEVDDGFVQLGTLKLLCQVDGDIKTNGNGVVVDHSTHLHFTITDERLVEELKKRNIPIPQSIKQRLDGSPTH